MAKELNEYQVRLTFDANTEKAKKQLKDLQQQLQSLATGSGTNKLNFSDEIAKASKAAAELSAHLSQATNMKTGTLDFTRLNDSIKKSGQSLANYGEQLLKLGPSGQQAFQKLATAVSNSEIPVRRISNTLREMGTVLKNTIKWQISSSAIHSFMGAVQSAYGYAQDLNESLNNIRIVTGQNIEQMEKFAATANKAARALSASTLDYTDAALIYYQQGLSDEEVKARTDVTVKMANVTGETAEKVSQQLTAVWNNFAKGADNLEYFADVMTALGAATASSTDEISAGLEKFSAVAETVGLSYEYATAALATVTATTRQSADVVGNAFKTIFARLEGLKLGETLEDDTDLNKYSAALHNVGVEIKNTDGSLKDMDTILDELSDRWQTLSRDQQMALAQTVAGVRQYNTLISLMNNWDFMQENLETARNASGELQKQSQTYAEGWEAAQKRVKAAAEGIYQSLLDDDFFITMLNGAEHVLDTINSLIKSLGGIPGVLSLIGNVFSRVFEKQIIQGLQNTAYNLQTLTASGRAKVAQEKQNAENAMLGLMPTVHMTEQDFGTHAEDNTRTSVMKEINDLQLTLNKNADKYNEIQLMTNQSLLEQKKIQGEKVVATGVQRDKVSIETGAGISDYMTRIRGSGILNEESQQIFDQRGSRLQNHILQSTFLKEFQKQFKEAQKSGTDFNLVLEKTQRILSRYSDQKSLNYFQELEKKFKEGKISAENYEQELEQLIQKTEKAIKYNSEGMMDQVNENLPNTEAGWIEGLQQEEDYTENFIGNAQRRAEAIRDNVFANDDFHESNERMKEDFNVVSQNYATWSSNLVQGAQAVMGLASSITMITGIMDSLWDGIASGTLTVKDVIANITTLGMLIPTILTGLNGLKSIEEGLRLAREAKNLATEKNITLEQAKHILDMKAAGVLPSKIAAYEAEAVAQNQVNTAEAANTPITAANAAAWYAHPIMWIAAVIMAVVVAISAISKAQEEHTKKLKENAEEAKRVADEYHKIVDEHQNLTNSFYKQIALYQETHEITNELIDSTLKLADAYGIQDARLKILQGRYKEVLSIIQMARQKELAEENEQLSNELNEEYELVKNSSTYKQTVVNSGPYAHTTDGKMFIDPNGDQEYLDAITGLYGKSGFENILSSSYGGQQYYRFNLDLSTPEQFLKSYKNVETIVEKSLKLSADRGTEVGSATQSLQDFLVEYKESYDQLLETTNAIDDNKTETTVLDNIIGKDINTIQDFHNISQRIINDLGNTEEAAKKVHQYFLDNPLYSEFAANDELLSSAAKDASLEFEEILNIYNSLPDEQKSIFFTIDFRKYKTEEAIREQLENMQAVADANSVYVELNTTSNAIKKLKASMTEEEYTAYKNDSGIQWGEDGVANYNEFLTLGYKQQKSYLQNILEKQRRDLIPSTIEGINGTLSEINYNNELKAQHQANIQPAVNQAKYFQGLGDNYWAEQFTQLAESETAKVNELTEANDGLNTKLQEQEEKLSNAIYSYASTATSLSDLNQITEVFNQSLLTNEEYQHAIDNALQSIAEQYDTCSDELDTFTFALTTQNDELIEAARNTLEYSIHTAELAEKMGLSVDDIEDQARAFREEDGGIKALISDGEELTKVSTTMASLNQSMNKGVAALTKNWDTWKKTLSTSEKTSMDYVDTIQELRTVLKDLTGVLDEDFIPKDFFDAPEVMELMDKAAQGDAKSINLLGTALAKASIEAKNFAEGMSVSLSEAIKQNAIDPSMNPFDFAENAFDYYKNNVLEGIENLNQAILNGTIQAGENITSLMDGTGASWVDSLNAMAMATGISVDEMNSLLNELGVQADVTTKTKTITTKVPIYQTEQKLIEGSIDSGTYKTETSSRIIRYEDMEGAIEVAQINMGDKAGTPPTIHYAGRSTPSTASTTSTSKGGGGGKGSGSPKKENKETKEDRYHVEEDRLDNLSKAYDRLEKAKSHAYGPDKLKYIQQEIDLLDDEIAAQEALVAETEKYLEQDVSQLNYGKKNAFYLEGVAYDQRGLDFYGLTAQIDQFGAIANYNEIIAAGLAQYNAAVDEYNTAGSAHYQDDNFLKYEKEQWQGLQDLVSQTEKTIDKNYEEITEYQEKIRQQNTLRMKKITSHLEFHIELNARDLKKVEYQLSKLGDDVYKTGEVAALLWSQSSDSKASLAVENIERYQSAYNELNTLLAAGQVNQDEYYEEIQKISDGLYEELGNIQDLNETAKTYYSDTLQKMGEKISWFTDRLAHNNTVLEHMKNIYMSLTQEDDFASIGKFIDASLSHAEKELEVAKATTDAYKEQKEARQLDFDEAKRLYEEALASGDENAIEAARNGLTIAENELKAITEAFEEAEENELEKFNQVISLMIEKVKNTIQQGYQDIEKTYTNDLGWDAINQQMSLAEKLGDKYLTKTNQAYEMSKLISQVNRDIDKTNNSNSKIRLRNFTTELENLKNTNQLSKNSLAIEQAKYEVLKAELALEEARDAKSTVRLQRDNEGNFGYVYTADRDNISDAEANLAQKQNDLYNLSLQQANDDAKELIQITQEKYNALRELDLKYATDQTNPVYLEQRVALEKYFDDLILANTKDHLIASQILQDTSITQENDSWSKEWEDLTKKHYGYITATDSFWTTNFANVTGKTQDFFNTNNPLWDAFYSGIMSNAKTTQETVTSEMKLMKTKNLPVLQLLADTIGDASLKGSLVNRYGSLETALGKIEATDKLVLATLLDGEGGEKGLITSLKEQATAASDATAEWQKWYTALLQEGGAVEAAQAINTEIQTMLEELAQIEDKEYTITKHEKTVYDAPVGSPTGTVYTTPPPSTTGTDTGGDGSGNTLTSTGTGSESSQSQSLYRLLLYSSSGARTVKYFNSLDAAHQQMQREDLSFGGTGTLYELKNGMYTVRETIEEYLEKLRGGNASANGSRTVSSVVSADTGMYTGSWGPEGKMAMLHEKELVLNKDDTANFLAGINILRQITDAIDLQALSMSAAAGVALPSLGNQAQALEQTVTITAEFPNVSNHLEIEEAFNNLVNRASQYANRF